MTAVSSFDGVNVLCFPVPLWQTPPINITLPFKTTDM